MALKRKKRRVVAVEAVEIPAAAPSLEASAKGFFFDLGRQLGLGIASVLSSAPATATVEPTRKARRVRPEPIEIAPPRGTGGKRLKLCSVPRCGRKHAAKGLCGMHYQQLVRDSRARGLRPALPQAKAPCRIPGCGKPSKARGLCNGHYDQDRLSRKARGALMHGGGPRKQPPAQPSLELLQPQERSIQ